MKDVLLVEAPDGFIVQGLVTAGGEHRDLVATRWARQVKETLTFLDDDIARFMEEAAARRGQEPPPPPHQAGYYETAFRVLGRYMDEQKPQDVFFFEQDGAFVVRLLHGRPAGQPPRAGRVHQGRHRWVWSGAARASATPANAADSRHARSEVDRGGPMKALKTVAVALGITLGALIVIPLAVLAGLFVWLKLTEEEDEEILELDREGV